VSLPIWWTRRAEKERDALDPTVCKDIIDGLDRYAQSGQGDVKRLRGCPEFRLRIGDWRVRFRAENGGIVIIAVAHRREAYRD
jgi:mRNA interferase RelE/StbE